MRQKRSEAISMKRIPEKFPLSAAAGPRFRFAQAGDEWPLPAVWPAALKFCFVF